MFDFRYHVASLVAVFLALVIGILVGVGISSRDVVSSSERKLLNARIASLEGRLESSEARVAALAGEQRAAEAFVSGGYSALMQNRLRGKRVAVAFVGPVDTGLRAGIQRTLVDAGAHAELRLRALKVPIDPRRLAQALGVKALVARFGADELGLGVALGREFVLGGDSRLWDRLSAQLVEERSGGARGAADAVVLVRSAPPQHGRTGRFLTGFYEGLRSTKVPVVAVEASGTPVSTTPTFARNGVSTVDDVDSPVGRLALALLLAGGTAGHYGVKPTAEDGVLPAVPPRKGG